MLSFKFLVIEYEFLVIDKLRVLGEIDPNLSPSIGRKCKPDKEHGSYDSFANRRKHARSYISSKEYFGVGSLRMCVHTILFFPLVTSCLILKVICIFLIRRRLLCPDLDTFFGDDLIGFWNVAFIVSNIEFVIGLLFFNLNLLRTFFCIQVVLSEAMNELVQVEFDLHQ